MNNNKNNFGKFNNFKIILYSLVLFLIFTCGDTALDDLPDIDPNRFSIDENEDGSTKPVVITTVSTNGLKGTISNIVRSSPVIADFKINDKGEITYTGSGLDHETTASYTLMVIASAGGKSVTNKLTLIVNDVDEPPFFYMEWVILEENRRASVDSPIPLTRPDRWRSGDPEGDPITYAIKSVVNTQETTINNPGFVINPANGVVSYVGDGLNYEDILAAKWDDPYLGNRYFEVIVTATANGLVSESTIRIWIRDVREDAAQTNNAPKFTEVEQQLFEIIENTPGPINVAKLSATDPKGNDVSFTMAHQGDIAYFEIDDNGQVVYIGNGTDGVFDYEGVNTVAGIRDIRFAVLNSDGYSNTYYMTVRVIDEDDPPAFSARRELVYHNVAEMANREGDPFFLYRVPVNDYDNDKITYNIESADQPGFIINPDTGRVYYIGSGLSAGDYILRISATANGKRATDGWTQEGFNGDFKLTVKVGN